MKPKLLHAPRVLLLLSCLAVAGKQSAPGAEDAAALETQEKAALDLLNHGQPAAAEKEYRALIATKERVLGPEHLSTLASRHRLAEAFDKQRKNAEAEKEYRAEVAGKEHTLGPEHKDTLKSRGFLAWYLGQEGKIAQAEEEYGTVIAIRMRIFGPEQADTLWQRNTLALMLEEHGKHVEAEKEFRGVAKDLEDSDDQMYSLVAFNFYSLALCLAGQGKNEEALIFARRAADAYKKQYSEKHRLTKGAEELARRIEEALRK